jgi:glycosyltransferase involved in cell wall biosynthesis
VLSYDLKYGPASVVKNNVTGFLFKLDDKRAFARSLIKFFKDIDMQKRMSNNCYEDAPRFGVDVFLEKWWALIEMLYKRMVNK